MLGEGAESMEQGQNWYLVAIAGNLKDQEFPVNERRLSLGREENNDIVLRDDNVSRRHLEIHTQDSKVIIHDLGSRNGTFINNERISGSVMMGVGDRLALGSHLLEVRRRPPHSAGFDAEINPAQPLPDDEEKTVVHFLSNQAKWMPGQEKAPSAKKRPTIPERPTQNEPVSNGYKTKDVKPAPNAFELEEHPTFIPGFLDPSEGNTEDVEEKTMIIPEALPSRRPQVEPVGFGAGINDVDKTFIRPSVPPPSAAQQAKHLNPNDLLARNSQMEMPPTDSPSLNPDLPHTAQVEGSPRLDDSSPDSMEGETASNRKAILIGGGILLLVAIVAVGLVIGQKSSHSAKMEMKKTQEHGLTVEEASPRADDLASLLKGEGGGSLTVGPQAYDLSEEEKALPLEQQRSLAKETFDEAVSFASSERLKEALREFNHALALDGSCDICMIRANKVALQLKKRIEKYNNDGLRYFQALKYEQASHSWEKALLLLDDPNSPAGERIKTKMAEAKQQHLKQSYR